MSKNTAKAALLACMCAILCACSAPPAVSGDSPATSAQPDMPQSKNTTTQQTSVTTQATSVATAQSTTTAAPEPDEPQADDPEYNFVSVLTEDDIEYMGIPYKDLTLEQFIQLWAQSTRECNLQRLYVITYNNAMPEDKPEAEHYVRDEMQQQLVWASRGAMPYQYDEVELIEDDLAPEGYYDNSNAEELCYIIRYKDIGFYYDYGADECHTEESWISVRKINGYWKIGIQFSSSPPLVFLTDATSAQPDIPQSECTTTQQTSVTTQATSTATPESDEPQIAEPEYNFVSVLTEDDIEYMGIPYKDLTLEQFIQLWAQSTRECNVQRLYVMTYNNDMSVDDNYVLDCMKQQLVWASKGYMPYRYDEVELIEDHRAPEGYYDDSDTEAHCYIIYFKNIGFHYNYGAVESETFMRWVELKKINGYWKIGMSASSSPPSNFLTES